MPLISNRLLQDGLVKNNMEKLTFYALSSPEKLDRIGEYLAQRVARDLNRHRVGYVHIAMQAMDQLLVACHAQSLNLFIESFLKIVQQLLETTDYQMQLLATSSFVRFANIEEDTPSYHRRYDFFVSKFSSLCHSNSKELDVRCKLRVAGLCGLRGVIRKTVSDDLQVDIWNEQHMDKIVPSLIYNLQDKETYLNIENGSSSCSTLQRREVKVYAKSKNPLKRPLNKQPISSKTLGKNLGIDLIQPTFVLSLDDESGNQQSQSIQPQLVAEECLRELIGRANYGSIRSVIKPVLKHLDHHNLWNDENEFAKNIFKIIMYSIQSQHSYAVIQILMGHLDEKSKQQNLLAAEQPGGAAKDEPDSVEVTTKVRTGIVNVLSSIVAIAAAESIGPSVLEIINSLLNYLHNSIRTFHQLKQLEGSSQAAEEESGALVDERIFQETIINTLGEFANNLPDFQKIEIMVFIINKVPKSDIYLQAILLKSLLKVSTKYETVNMVQAFPSNFLNPLLKLSTAHDAHVRLTVQFIFHQLLDRNKNLPKLRSLTTLSALPVLTIGKAFRQDLMFMKKHGNEVLLRLYENFKFPNNNLANYHALHITMALLCLEMGTEILAELLRFIFAVQDYALNCRPIKQTVTVEVRRDPADDDRPAENGRNEKNGAVQTPPSANPTISLQHQLSVSGNGLSDLHVCAIHAIVATFLRFTSQLTSIPAFVDYVEEIIKQRDTHFKYLLPEHNPLITNLDDTASLNHSISAGDSDMNYTFKFEPDLEQLDNLPLKYHADECKFDQLNESLIFNKNNIIEALLSSGHDTSLLQTPFTTGQTGR